MWPMLRELLRRREIARRNDGSLCLLLNLREFLAGSPGADFLVGSVLGLHDRVPCQARTAEQVSRVGDFAHDDAHFFGGYRLGSLKHRLLQSIQIEIGNRCHSSPKNDDLRVENANEVGHAESEKAASAVEDVQGQ